jgi:predicted DNA-binding protein (UPF0278 family)
MTEQDMKENETLEDEGVEVELEGTEAETSQEESAQAEPAQEAEPQKDELNEYSKNVQNRIKKLTEKYRKAERDGQEASRLAQQLIEENKKLKSQVTNLDKGYVSSEEARLQAQLESAKRQYREAYESGDADKMFDAQQLISQIGVAQDRVNQAKARFERQQAEPAATAQPAPQPQAQQPQAPQPDPKAQEWAEKNEWFGTDEVMTYAAFGIHRKLVEEEGFDPQSEEYYTEVDRRIRAEFPQKFATAKKSSGAQVASAGASASRSTAKSGRRSVKLSPSQIAMAKKLNVPLEEYAKYVKE